MNLDPGSMLLGIVAGLAAGGLYFGGLYATTRRLATSTRPALMTLLSFVVRTLTIVATAILVATTLGASALLAFAVGLTVVRIVLVSRVRRGVESSGGPAARGAATGGNNS